MAHKIVTYSMDPITLERMDKLRSWLGISDKSKILRTLIEREYFRQLQQREEEDTSQD